MQTINVGSMLNRFWVTGDLIQLDRVDRGEPVDGSEKPQLGRPSYIRHDNLLSSVLGDDDLACEQRDRANLFALQHRLNQDDKTHEEDVAERTARLLEIDRDVMTDEIVRLANGWNATLPQGDERWIDDDDGRLRDLAAKALTKLLNSVQATEASKSGRLSEEGRLALKNAALGVIRLLQSGKLHEDAVLYLVDNATYDLSNGADLLQLATNALEYVHDAVLDEAKVGKTCKVVTDCLSDCLKDPGLTQARRKALEDALTRFQTAQDALLRRGKELTRGLENDLRLLSPLKGGVAKAEQETALTRVLEAFRSFNLSQEDLAALAQDGKALNRAFAEVSLLLGEINPTQLPKIHTVLPDIVRLEKGVAEAGEDAMSIAHEAIDRIHHYLGGESGFTREMHELLDRTAENGGMRSFTLGGGGGFGAKFGEEKRGAGAKFQGEFTRRFTVSVPLGGGPVSVITYKDFDAALTAGGKFGAKKVKRSDGSKVYDSNGVGAELSGGIGGSVGKGDVETFPTLDDAIRSMRDQMLAKLLTSESAGRMVLRFLTKPFRMLGSALRGLFRQKPQIKADNLAFRRHLSKVQTMGRLDRILVPKQNAQRLSHRTYWQGKGGGKFKAKCGVYTAGKEDTNFGFGGKFGASHEREFHAHLDVMKSFLDELSEKDGAALQKEAVDSIKGLASQRDTADEARFLGHLDAVWSGLTECLSGNQSDAGRLELATECLGQLDALLDESEALAGAEPDKEQSNRFIARHRAIAACFVILRQQIETLMPADEFGQMDSVSRLFANRLTNPSVRLDKTAYDGLFKPVEALAGERKRTTFELGGGIDALGGKVGQIPAYPLESAADVLREKSGLKTDFSGKLTIDSPKNPTDNRPWKNTTIRTLDVKVSSSMTMQVLMELVARHVVKSMYQEKDEATVGQLVKKMSLELAEDLAFQCAIPSGVLGAAVLAGDKVMDVAAQYPSFGKFLVKAGYKKASEVAAIANSAVGIDFGTKDKRSKVITFTFEGGNFKCVGFADERATSLRAGLNFLGGNLHGTVTTLKRETERVVFPRPSLEMMLGKTEELLQTGRPGQLRKFLTANHMGALRLYSLVRNPSVKPAGAEDSRWEKDGEEVVRLNAEADGLLRVASRSADAATVKNAELLERRLETARQKLKDMRENASAARKLDALQGYLTALTAVFQFGNKIPEAKR